MGLFSFTVDAVSARQRTRHASRLNRGDIARLLLDAGAHAAPTIDDYANAPDSSEVFELLLDCCCGTPPPPSVWLLCAAIKADSAPTIESLLHQLQPWNSEHKTNALLAAASSGRIIVACFISL